MHGAKGSITKGGTPRGKCPASSAAGALNAATHGRWTGKYFASCRAFSSRRSSGRAGQHKDYWSIFVNGKLSNKGICEIKLRAGQRLLFKIVKEGRSLARACPIADDPQGCNHSDRDRVSGRNRWLRPRCRSRHGRRQADGHLRLRDAPDRRRERDPGSRFGDRDADARASLQRRDSLRGRLRRVDRRAGRRRRRSATGSTTSTASRRRKGAADDRRHAGDHIWWDLPRLARDRFDPGRRRLVPGAVHERRSAASATQR